MCILKTLPATHISSGELKSWTRYTNSWDSCLTFARQCTFKHWQWFPSHKVSILAGGGRSRGLVGFGFCLFGFFGVFCVSVTEILLCDTQSFCAVMLGSSQLIIPGGQGYSAVEISKQILQVLEEMNEFNALFVNPSGMIANAECICFWMYLERASGYQWDFAVIRYQNMWLLWLLIALIIGNCEWRMGLWIETVLSDFSCVYFVKNGGFSQCHFGESVSLFLCFTTKTGVGFFSIAYFKSSINQY